ncbi:MAG: hypothetical protein AAGI63_18325 [Planctomycetota bacterium]
MPQVFYRFHQGACRDFSGSPDFAPTGQNTGVPGPMYTENSKNAKRLFLSYWVALIAVAALSLPAWHVEGAGACCAGSSETEGVPVTFHIRMCLEGSANATLKGRNIDDQLGDTLTQTGGNFDGTYDTRNLVEGVEYKLTTAVVNAGDEIQTTHIGLDLPDGYYSEIVHYNDTVTTQVDDRNVSREINTKETVEDSWGVVVRRAGSEGGEIPAESFGPFLASVTWGVDLGALPNGQMAGRKLFRGSSYEVIQLLKSKEPEEVAQHFVAKAEEAKSVGTELNSMMLILISSI